MVYLARACMGRCFTVYDPDRSHGVTNSVDGEFNKHKKKRFFVVAAFDRHINTLWDMQQCFASVLYTSKYIILYTRI